MKTWMIWLVATVLLLTCDGELRARRLYRGHLQTQQRLADRMASWIERRAGAGTVDSPGGARFDGEWALMTCQLSLLGFAQVVAEHPELTARYRPASRTCADWLVTAEARAFGTAAWQADGLTQLDGKPTHAYLGYLNAALTAHRQLDPSTPHAALNDALTASLAAGLEAEVWQLQTYPGEAYPADMAVVAGSIAAYDRATGADHSALLADWSRRFKKSAVDPGTGLVFQSLSPETGKPTDRPRGSGTGFAAYFLAEVDPDLSAALYDAMEAQGLAGMAGMREYPPGVRGTGDIDSGPVIFGVSVAATGFGIAGARVHEDPRAYRRLVRTSTVFGVPVGGWHLTGGALGNAVMLAMLTAQPLE